MPAAEEDHTKFPEQAKFILAMAVNLKRNQPQLSGEIYEGTRSVIHYLLDNLLSQEITEPNNLRLANRMRKHRKAMLAFLDHVEVEPTNNIAERQIRPGVLQRKISAGNRSEAGAEIHSTLLSIFATAKQQGHAFLALAIKALRNPAQPVLALSARSP
jgi:transposase